MWQASSTATATTAVSPYVCVCVCVCVYTYTYIYTCTCTYAYIQIYTHTHMAGLQHRDGNDGGLALLPSSRIRVHAIPLPALCRFNAPLLPHPFPFLVGQLPQCYICVYMSMYMYMCM